MDKNLLMQAPPEQWEGCDHLDCLPECKPWEPFYHCERLANLLKIPPSRCCECGIEEKGATFLFERQGKVYCEDHLLNTPAKRAYEKWFVEPNS